MDLIELVTRTVEQLGLDSHEHIELSMCVLDQINADNLRAGNIGAIDRCVEYWKHIMIRSTNPYARYVCSMQSMLDRYTRARKPDNVQMVHVVPCAMFDDHLYQVLKHAYPLDLIKHDELIDQIVYKDV
jgi:hypothetical protein